MALLCVPAIDRPGFFADLNQMIAKRRQGSDSVGLIVVDIRNFTRLNCIYGFSVGDLLLYSVFERLSRHCGKLERPYRLGDDQFAVLLPGVKNPAELLVGANSLLEQLTHPHECQGQEITIDVNMGCAGLPAASATAARLLNSAERMLQQARRDNRAFCYGMEPRAEKDDKRWLLEQDLLRALHNNELDMVFQPKVDLRSGGLAHAEALLRWRHSVFGCVAPARLVEMLSQLNREFHLSRWALHTALKKLREWPVTKALPGVAVNIPANIVHHPEFPHLVEDALHIWQAQPGQLTLEITEDAIVENQQASFDNLERLKRQGIQISIDDFGTGYSSLQYFKSIPATELKIDQSFIINMATSEDDRNIAQLIIELAHRFGLKVVAEGVEHAEVLECLRALGCDYAQGFYIAEPLSHEAYCDWLAREHSPGEVDLD